MANLADLTIGVGVDDNLSAGLTTAGQKVETFGDKVARQSQKLVNLGDGMQSAGRKMTMFATLPIAAGFFKATGAAEDLNESVNAVNVVFEDAAEGVLKLSDNAATAVGLSKSEFNSLAVQFSSFASTLAGDGGDVTAVLEELTGRASDFASVMNLDVSEAARLFQSGLAGETEPLKKYGINLSAAAVEAHALEKGITADTSAMTESEKIQARYSLLMEQTAKTQGDFANTSEESANAQRIATARAADMAAEFGQNLIPVKTRVLELASGLLDRFNSMSPAMKTMSVAIAGVVAAAGPLLFITGTLVKGVGALGVALAGVSAPVLIAVGAVAALAAGLVYAYNRSETFRQVVQTVWAKVQEFIPKAVKAIRKVIAGFVDWATGAWDRWGADIMAVVRDTFAIVVEVVSGAVKGIRATIQAWTVVIRNIWEKWGSGIVSYLRQMWNNIAQFIDGAITTIRGIIQTVLAIIRGDWSGAWEGIKTIALGVWNMIQGIVRQALNILQSLIAGTMSAVMGIWQRAWAKVRSVVSNAIGNVMDAVRGLKDQVVGFFAGAGRWLVNAGKSIIRGLVSGIGSMASAPVDAVKGIVGKVRNLLPGSPVKEGPLKVLNHGYAGGQIVKMLADGMGSETNTLAKMAERTAAAALPGLGTPGVPRVAAVGGDGASAGGDMDAKMMRRELRLMREAVQRQSSQTLITAMNRSEHLHG